MKGIKFDRLLTDFKLTALANITRHVKEEFKKDGVTSDSAPESYLKAVTDHKINWCILNLLFDEKGNILKESIKPIKGVLDYGREQF